MIESLRIRNFQRIADLEIDFDPHVTTIVGPSGIGKSSVLRCLRWLATGKPSGQAFVRKGASKAVAKLVVDGKAITRARGKDANWCKLDGETYKAMGKEVPEPIAQLLNLSDASFQKQHDPIYLFSLTAGQAAQALNEVVALSGIDSALSELGSELRKAKQEVAQSEERLIDAQKKVKELEWVKEADNELKGLEKREKECLALRTRSTELSDLVREGETLKEDQKAAGNRAGEAEEGIARIQDKHDRMWAAKERADRLRDLIGQIEDAGVELCQARKEAERAEKELAKLTAKGCPLCGK